ncbi:MAG: HNH endonuclease [Nitrospina sp.]|nr:HNH endonuclease [Nitrospina sp.]
MLDNQKVLILNYSYEPLQFCTAKRGIIMVLSGRAEKIETNGYVVRSPNFSFPLPTVIRVLKMVRRNRRNRGKGVAFSKKNIMRRDNYTCQYCGVREKLLTVDHIIPKSRGGETNWMNVVVACKPCNLKKGNRTAVEAGMALNKKPFRPSFHYHSFVIPSASPEHLESWYKYLPPSLRARNVFN